MTAPVIPAQQGTFWFASEIGARYTVGREHVFPVLEELGALGRTLALDIETEGVGVAAMRLKAVTVGTEEHAVVMDPRDPDQASLIRWALEFASRLIVHNSPFDVPILVRNGLMRVADIAKVVDTLIYCRLAEPDERTSKSLLAASARYLGTDSTDALTQAFKALGLNKSEGFRVFDLDRPLYVQGAAADVILTARLLKPARDAALRTLLEHPFGQYGTTAQEAEELVEREQVINRLFLRRSAKGMRVDLDFLDEYRAKVARQQSEDTALLESLGIKPGHGGSLIKYLDGAGLLPDTHPRTEKTGAPKSDKAALGLLKNPVAEAFVRQKESEKIDSHYLQKVVDLSDGGRIHPTTNILGAATGRMSMGDPPLHQFPSEARGIILADEGDQLTSIDWSQIEPVVAANIAKDEGVLAGYEDGSSDLYTTIAETARITRKEAKVVVLAQMYGEGMTKLSNDLGVTLDAAYDLRRAVFRAMPRVAALITKLREIGEREQKIFTLSGRIVPIPSGQYGVAVHKAVNYHVQGSAYDVLAEALVSIEKAGLGDAVYLAMHDELVVSTEAAGDIEQIMRTPPERLVRFAKRVPVLRTDRADMGNRWAYV